MNDRARVRKSRSEELIWKGHPSWKGMLRFYFKWLTLTVAASVLTGYLWRQGYTTLPIFALVTFTSNGLVLGAGKLIRNMTTYTISTKRIAGRRFIVRDKNPDGSKGRFHPRTRQEEAPIERIDNVIVEQGILIERLLGVGHINFDTAGEREGDLHRWWGIANPHHVATLIETQINPREEDERFDDERFDDERDDDAYLAPSPRDRQRSYIAPDDEDDDDEPFERPSFDRDSYRSGPGS